MIPSDALSPVQFIALVFAALLLCGIMLSLFSKGSIGFKYSELVWPIILIILSCCLIADVFKGNFCGNTISFDKFNNTRSLRLYNLARSECLKPFNTITGSIPVLGGLVLFIVLIYRGKQFQSSSTWMQYTRKAFLTIYFVILFPIITVVTLLNLFGD